MEHRRIELLLITANVGSLFEEFGNQLRRNWISEFEKLVFRKKPLFVGLHFQEVGGKTLEVCKDQVKIFFDDLHKSPCFQDFGTRHSFIDQEYEEEKYTALGCCFFIHKSLSGIFQLWNFKENCFQDVPNGNVISFISHQSSVIQKYKFPLTCFSKHVNRWPRKGFLWTRWRFNEKIFDMLNIHLTHDANNIKASLKSPSKYTKHRRRCLQYALERVAAEPSQHQILFGDFNVRPDTKALIEHLMQNTGTQYLEKGDDGEPVSLTYKAKNGSTKDLLQVGCRFFQLHSYEAFRDERIPDVVSFDKELNWILEDQFREMPITFQPTYPHTEPPDYEGEHSFSNVRCPSWCDRIILDEKLFHKCVEHSDSCTYNSYGAGVQLGDHKPVFLTFEYTFG